MRLSPNHKLAILCGLVAIPTAIVVWAKATSKDRPGAARHRDEVDDDDGPDALQRYAAEQERAAAARKLKADDDAAAMKARAGMIAPLFADGRAGAPGPLFDGLTLDQEWSADAIRGPLDQFRADTGANVTILPDEISVFVPSLPGVDDDSLRAAAVTAWGPTTNDRWLDEVDHVRAKLAKRPGAASVTWQRTISALDLFPSDPVVASSLVPAVGGGVPAATPLGSHANATATGYSYVLPGLGWSNNPVHIDVDVDVDVDVAAPHGVVTAVHVHTNALSDAELQPIRLALAARYGAPSTPARTDGFEGAWTLGALAITSTVKYPDGMIIDLTRAPTR